MGRQLTEVIMKYKVKLRDTSVYELIIDAENEDEAMDVGWDKLTSMAEHEKDKYYVDSDGDSSAEKVE